MPTGIRHGVRDVVTLEVRHDPTIDREMWQDVPYTLVEHQVVDLEDAPGGSELIDDRKDRLPVLTIQSHDDGVLDRKSVV